MRIAVSRFIILIVCTTLTLEACGGGQPPDDTRAAPPAKPATDAPTLQGPYGVYVTNEVSGDLSVIDPATHTAIATLPLGKRPRGIRVSPDRTQLYVALSGSPISPPGVDESKLPPPDRTADGIGRRHLLGRRIRA